MMTEHDIMPLSDAIDLFKRSALPNHDFYISHEDAYKNDLNIPAYFWTCDDEIGNTFSGVKTISKQTVIYQANFLPEED